MTDLEHLVKDKYDGDATLVTEEDKQQLAAGVPLAYVIGWIPFLGVKVYLSTGPLIPRPETEWWAEKLIDRIGDKPLSVLDLCSGSGAVGLALLKHTNVEVTFSDLEEKYEEDVRRSIAENGLDASRAHFASGDLFENVSGTFDIIATNPPYIPSSRTLDESVTKHEPASALFSGEDGLTLIRRIAEKAPTYIKEGGELWLEADVENVEEAGELLRGTVHQDLYGRPRLVVAYY